MPTRQRPAGPIGLPAKILGGAKLIVQPPYSHWAFRGERDGAGLYSSLSRYLQNFGVDQKPGRNRKAAYCVFKRKAHRFLVQPRARR
jgi:hypothetical protein